jgi:hypothetical protein
VQVDDADLGVLLAQAVDAPDALLHPHGVPGHVVVHEGPAKLEVQALGRGIGADHDLGATLAEALFGRLPGDHLPVARRGEHLATPPGEADHPGSEGID